MASIALLDDYQNVALKMADWSRLQASHRITVFNKHLPIQDEVAKALAGFEIIGIMRERTPFPRALFERLPDLKLLITTGLRNASIDVKAAGRSRLTVCGTNAGNHATAELAFGLCWRWRGTCTPSSTTCAKAAGKRPSATTCAAKRWASSGSAGWAARSPSSARCSA